MSFSQTSKSGLMIFVYLHMESHKRVLPLYSSNAFASCTDLVIFTSKLCVQTQYFYLSFPMMWLRFANTCRIHHANAGSPKIQICTAYSAICTGYEFFLSLRVSHVVIPSFHSTRTSTPFIVSMRRFVLVRVVMNASWSFT